MLVRIYFFLIIRSLKCCFMFAMHLTMETFHLEGSVIVSVSVLPESGPMVHNEINIGMTISHMLTPTVLLEDGSMANNQTNAGSRGLAHEMVITVSVHVYLIMNHGTIVQQTVGGRHVMNFTVFVHVFYYIIINVQDSNLSIIIHVYASMYNYIYYLLS